MTPTLSTRLLPRIRLLCLRAINPFPRTTAGWVVFITYVASVALLLSFVARHVSRVPYFDEYANLQFLFGAPGKSPSAYWSQHNEHRIPLPRLVYVASVRLSGMDIRTPNYVNAVLLCAAAAFLLRAVHRVRRYFSIADGFVPLMVLGLGGWENLIWGFQLQFVISTVLILAFIALIMEPGFAASWARLLAASVICVLLPMCGANGVALVPALSCFLLFVAVSNIRVQERKQLGWLALVGGLTGFLTVTAYFSGLEKVSHHTGPGTLDSVAIGAVNFLGMGMGPVIHLLHAPGYEGITIVGALVHALLAATTVLLIFRIRERESRDRVVGVLCVLGGLVCLGLGLAYGRASMGNITAAGRYVTLAMPIPIAIYLAWVSLGRGRVARIIPFTLFGLAALWFVPNTRFANEMADLHAMRLRKVEYEIKTGMPIGFIVDRNPFVYPGPLRDFRTSLEILRDEGVEPFRNLRPDPKMTSDRVPLRPVRVVGMTVQNGEYLVTEGSGVIVLALPRKQHVYGLALTYEASREGSGRPVAFLSWDEGARSPPANGFGIFDHFVRTEGPTTTRIFVDKETDLLRIDLFWNGSRLRIHDLAILTPIE